MRKTELGSHQMTCRPLDGGFEHGFGSPSDYHWPYMNGIGLQEFSCMATLPLSGRQRVAGTRSELVVAGSLQGGDFQGRCHSLAATQAA